MLCRFFNRKFNGGLFSGLLFFSAASVLCGQTPSGYTLIKTGLSVSSSSPSIVTYQWIASNHTGNKSNFFILENIPGLFEIQSIVEDGLFNFNPTLNPSLPLSGPASVVVGPFAIPANASVTFRVTGINHSGKPRPSGEVFTLVSESQLSGKNSQGLLASSIIGRQDTPTPVATATAALQKGLIQTAVAKPNISRGSQPIHFSLVLGSSARIDLSIYTVTGERVYDTQAQGGITGENDLVWQVWNNAHGQVASGLYVYFLRVSGDTGVETRTGKILVIH